MEKRTSRTRSAFRLGPALAVGLGLLVAFPRWSEGALSEPPAVALGSLHVDPHGAVTAPVEGGGTATLTLDASLEQAATRLLQDARAKTGALVALDARTGKLLAWAGTHGASVDHSVVASTFAPAASLFKLVTTAALLEKHVNPDREVCVSGGSSVLTEEHLVRPRGGNALCAPFREALGRSRNAVFAQLATRYLRPDDLVRVSSRLGFGGDASFDVPAAVGTLDVPDGKVPFARAAAGFVGSRLSAPGAAHLATTIATFGKVLHVQVVEHADGYDAPRRRRFVGTALPEGTARELARMMEVTIHSGTSREVFTAPDGHSFLGDVRAAGKTGTLHGDAEDATTSWFVGFAPARAPRIVLAVLLENGETWRRKANEVGRDFLRVYFARRGARGVTMPDGF
ncbi:MAG TPA: penicillin-binding transpeptidase domain-containing protein [Polyangiaceae bacterium]|nr:penicillin-binding transpeptidase domain-containing protein [Polyangiaceae bacterium]